MILANITDAETNYSKFVVVDFDHGVMRDDYSGDYGTPHYMFEDNIGTLVGEYPGDEEPLNAVYDMDVYSRTGGDKALFAFINTCLSADLTYQDDTNPIQGMPLAWTHCEVTSNPGSGEISDDGYGDPDDGDVCYMGFPYGSAALSQTITGISPIYATWLENFFWYALSYDISVNDALDEASLDNFEDDFDDTDLATNFGAVWPMWNPVTGWEDPPYYGCSLVVYGNGNIHLYEYFVHDYVGYSSSGVNAGVVNPDGIEGGSNDNSYTQLYAVGWYGDQAVITGSIGWEASGHIYLYGRTDSGYNSHVLVYVSYDYNHWIAVNENLWVSQSSSGWIDVGTFPVEFKYIAIVVYADTAPSSLYVDSVLVIPELEPLEYYWVSDIASTTDYEDGFVSNPDGLVGSSNDESYVQIYGGNPDDGGNIVGEMTSVSDGDIYLWGYSASGYSTHLYVYVSYYNNYDWTQTSVQTVYPDSEHWIYCGSGSNFRYIAIAAIDDNGFSANIYLDSVKVVP